MLLGHDVSIDEDEVDNESKRFETFSPRTTLSNCCDPINPFSFFWSTLLGKLITFEPKSFSYYS